MGLREHSPSRLETPRPAFERLYRTTVEVIDPRTARVVTQRVLDEWIVAALPGNRAAAYSVDERGMPRITIVQLSLQGR